ncbi:uncharacterized protein LOC108864107 [Galendromus occidentalis]|uniref:Uncharacterized protein LOC108864107 n=1 Tax=Galendromus occidentalis TaxID=34638 RepID=A0AAJ7L3F0_9ACAR|nr:uncharacterized protein LOC108864107 [Galendromus occidentalis]
MGSLGVHRGQTYIRVLSFICRDIADFLPKDVKYLIYADDLKVWCPIMDRTSCAVLQNAIDGVDKLNDMSLSPHKTVVLQSGRVRSDYFLNGVPLPISEETRDLGVAINTALDFKHHISNVAKSAFLLINCIFRSIITKRPELYLGLYNSLVMPKFLYCSPLWNPSQRQHIDLLGRVQNRFLRRLRYRCNLQRNDVTLPDLKTLLDKNDDSMLRTLFRASLLEDMFTITGNRLRSKFSIRPKTVARSKRIQNLFPWRMADKLRAEGFPLYLQLLSSLPPSSQ